MKLKNVGKFQEGGAMPPQDPAATQGAQDPMAMILEGAMQAIQSQDCQIALQVCQALAEMAGASAQPAPEAEAPTPPVEGEPVFRTGGILVRRIKK